MPAGMGLAGALDAWDEHLAVKGAELLAGRLELTAALRPLVARAYAAVSGEEGEASISYQQRGAAAGGPPARAPRDGSPGGTAAGVPRGSGPEEELPGAVGEAATRNNAEPGSVVRSVLTDPGEPDSGRPGSDLVPSREALAEGLREALVRSRPEELERGICLVGPHRDDLDLSIGELPTRGYASHGEAWSMALALRLSGYELLRAGGDDPVLLLDDVFAELDVGRRDRLASLVADAEQVLVTAAVPADVPERLLGTRFDVVAGEVSRAS
jgi:DNA replication and repair protein RecF